MMGSEAVPSPHATAVSRSSELRHIAGRARCNVFGHDVDNRVFAQDRTAQFKCPCGAGILREDGSTTHVSHTLMCFFLGHVYAMAGGRDDHVESVCVRCGHPLIVERASPFARHVRFRKLVRYACGVFGHQVHEVVERNGFVEYACHCGHSFLSEGRVQGKIRHPIACVTGAHNIEFIERRFGFAEFRCRRCGHPFCFPARL